MGSRIKFVFSDIGGVLFDEKGTDYLVSKYNLDPESFKVSRQKYLKDAIVGKTSPEEMFRLTTLNMGKEVNITEYNSIWCANSHPYLESHEMLEKISHKYPVGLLTNIVKDTLGEYRKNNLYPDLDYKTIIQSAEVGYAKPDKQIYEIAERESIFSGSEIFFIDDLKPNIETAEKMGWTGFWFDRKNREESIKKILELLEIF